MKTKWNTTKKKEYMKQIKNYKSLLSVMRKNKTWHFNTQKKSKDIINVGRFNFNIFYGQAFRCLIKFTRYFSIRLIFHLWLAEFPEALDLRQI